MMLSQHILPVLLRFLKITISELNYNADSALNSGDWIELKNFGSQAVDLSGWVLSDGADNHMYHFPTGTVLAAGAYLVVVEDSVKFKSQFPTVSNRIGQLGFNYGNGGDEVRLFDYNGNLYLNFFYSDLAPWPLTPDGGGYTCELLNVNGDLNDGNNWFAGCIGGSPRTGIQFIALGTSFSNRQYDFLQWRKCGFIFYNRSRVYFVEEEQYNYCWCNLLQLYSDTGWYIYGSR